MSDDIARDSFILAGSMAGPLTAQAMGQSVIVSSLPTFSCTAPPMLPSENGAHAVLRDRSELWQLFCIEAPLIALIGPG